MANPTQIQLRRDTAANWALAKTVLALGEPGIESDTKVIKYGDGVSVWSTLPAAGGGKFLGQLNATVDSLARPLTLSAAAFGYVVAYSAAGTLTLSPQAAPWLWQDSQGVAQFMHSPTLKATGYGCNGKVYAFGTVTGSHDFYAYSKATGGWAKQNATQIDTGSGIFNVGATDSRGYHFAAWAPSGGAGAQNLYRSTDDGATWSAVITSAILIRANDYIGGLIESDNGWLYCTAYNGIDSAQGGGNGIQPTKGLFRSKDGGATWTNIYANVALVNDYLRHLHCLHWDEFRKALWISGGDGSATAVCVSTDYGDTWTAWTNTVQTTAICATATAILLCSDVAGYHDINRVASPASTGVAGILSQTPRPVYKIGTKRSPVAPIAGLRGDEFPFGMYLNEKGILVVSYGRGGTGCALLASADDGVTWVDMLGATATTASTAVTASVTEWAFSPVRPTRYAPAQDGWLYGIVNGTGGTLSTRRYRVYPSQISLHVNSATGDDVSGDGVVLPFASVPESGVTSAATVVLDADYLKQATLCRPGLVLNRGTFTLGAVDGGGTLAVSENFEGTSTLTTSVSATGTVSQTSATNPYQNPFLSAGGTQNLRCTAVAAADTAFALKANALTGVANGQDCWMTGYFALSGVASITATTVLMQFQGGVNISVYNVANGAGLIATTVADSRIYQQDSNDSPAFPIATYVRIVCCVRKDPAKGRIRLWTETLDGPVAVRKLLLDVQGVNTGSGAWTNARWGAISGAQAGLVVDVDNVTCSIGFDPDYPPAYLLKGGGQLVMPEMALS